MTIDEYGILFRSDQAQSAWVATERAQTTLWGQEVFRLARAWALRMQAQLECQPDIAGALAACMVPKAMMEGDVGTRSSAQHALVAWWRYGAELRAWFLARGRMTWSVPATALERGVNPSPEDDIRVVTARLVAERARDNRAAAWRKVECKMPGAAAAWRHAAAAFDRAHAEYRAALQSIRTEEIGAAYDTLREMHPHLPPRE